MIGMRLDGIDELMAAIDRAERRYDKAVQIATGKAAAIIQKAAQANIDPTGDVHKDPSLSNLRKHVKRRVYKRLPGVVGIVIGPLFPGMTPQQRSYYGDWLEKGHRTAAPGKRLAKAGSAEPSKKRGQIWRNQYSKGIIGLERRETGTSTVPPHPWLRPAFDHNKARAEAEMARVFKDATEGRITESAAVAALEELLLGE